MYNRYIPEDVSYTPVEPLPPPPPPEIPGSAPQHRPFRLPDVFAGKEGLASLLKGRGEGGLSSLLKGLNLDSGDILLLLIILYLFVEGEDPDLAIALGVVLLMGDEPSRPG